MVLVERRVAHEPGARVAAFEQIVTEDAIIGKPMVQRLLEGIDLVDALADERAFTEQILIDVGDAAGIRVEAGLAAMQLCVTRSVRAGQACCHTRLQDAVTFNHPSLRNVVARAIQRMRHCPDELPRRVARQLRIGVQRDHVFDVAQDVGIPDDARKAVAGRTTQ